MVAVLEKGRVLNKEDSQSPRNCIKLDVVKV
jgi:hypothetical protein